MKTEVYSWRLSPTLKAELEQAARAEGASIAALLARIARDWLREREGLTTIFTIDHDDFDTHRIGARRRLRVVPGR